MKNQQQAAPSPSAIHIRSTTRPVRKGKPSPIYRPRRIRRTHLEPTLHSIGRASLGAVLERGVGRHHCLRRHEACVRSLLATRRPSMLFDFNELEQNFARRGGLVSTALIVQSEGALQIAGQDSFPMTISPSPPHRHRPPCAPNGHRLPRHRTRYPCGVCR